MPKKKRERSKTPEVPWEQLLVERPVPPVPSAEPIKRRRSSESLDVGSSRSKSEQSTASTAPEQVGQGPPAGAGASTGAAASKDSAAAFREERDTWRSLVVHLAALRGDPKVEAFLAETSGIAVRSHDLWGHWQARDIN